MSEEFTITVEGLKKSIISPSKLEQLEKFEKKYTSFENVFKNKIPFSEIEPYQLLSLENYINGMAKYLDINEVDSQYRNACELFEMNEDTIKKSFIKYKYTNAPRLEPTGSTLVKANKISPVVVERPGEDFKLQCNKTKNKRDYYMSVFKTRLFPVIAGSLLNKQPLYIYVGVDHSVQAKTFLGLIYFMAKFKLTTVEAQIKKWLG